MTTQEQERKRLKVDMAVVLTSLVEMDGYWSPLTPIYLALGANMERYNQVIDVLRTSGLVTADSETVRLTPSGVEVANKVKVLLEPVKQRTR